MAARKREAPRMGRPPGPPGPPELVRRNRVMTTFTDGELEHLERLSKREGVPLGTLIHRAVKRALRLK